MVSENARKVQLNGNIQKPWLLKLHSSCHRNFFIKNTGITGFFKIQLHEFTGQVKIHTLNTGNARLQQAVNVHLPLSVPTCNYLK